ncbi:unnamed protein product [Blepharisma stoltei]|uniref:AP180 N-terminal homology (ANTH) domain-containing protein n=1 Tax=Blepharisma stoltei TaxID=1481888 RepID=A0AAU9JRZ1_9CILI|nr:unnamed protein product [Blepharisma stoltei]
MDKFKTSLSKATRSKDCNPPKAKHLSALLYAIEGNSNLQIEKTFPLIVHRLRDSCTQIRFKTMMILFHFIKRCERKNVFSSIADLNLQLNFFCDDNYPRAHCCPIIHPLFSFLKLRAKANLQYEEILKNWRSERLLTIIQEFRDDELIEITRLFVEQLSEFLSIKDPLCKALEYKSVLTCVIELAKWLMCEVAQLYAIFKSCIQVIIWVFPRLNVEMAKEAKEFCFMYNTFAARLKDFCSSCSEYYEGELPMFRGLREDTLHGISEQVKEQENIRYSQNLISMSPPSSPPKKAVQTPGNPVIVPQQVIQPQFIAPQPMMFPTGPYYPVMSPQFSPYMMQQPIMYPHMMPLMQANSPFLRK